MPIRSSLDKVRTATSGLSTLAITMALPHENKAQRLPVVPATLTSVLELMTDDTISVAGGTVGTYKRLVLTRDPAFPLWVDMEVTKVFTYVECTGQWTLPATASTSLGSPDWSAVNAWCDTGAKINGVTADAAMGEKLFVLGTHNGVPAWYVPSGGYCTVAVLTTGANQTGKTLTAQLKYYFLGEWMNSTILLAGYDGGFLFSGRAGSGTATTGQMYDGNVPQCWVRLDELLTSAVAPVTFVQPYLQCGWSSGSCTWSSGIVVNSDPNMHLLLPFSPPPEWQNSVIPYQRTRATATAVLISNVTAVLAKEGTVLAGRLKNELVDFSFFSSSDINSVHPRLRYFGPLEKGLYTFTTPSSLDSMFVDCVYSKALPALTGGVYAITRPMFQYGNVGLYNAVILTDVGSAEASTTMAVSSYTHLEFELTSSLFVPGVSTYTLEQLHAAEVALLTMGHFHENPLHWEALRRAATTALSIVGPMVAPYVKSAGTHLLNRGVALLTGSKASGNRAMPQAMSSAGKIPAKKKVVVAKPAARKRK